MRMYLSFIAAIIVNLGYTFVKPGAMEIIVAFFNFLYHEYHHDSSVKSHDSI